MPSLSSEVALADEPLVRVQKTTRAERDMIARLREQAGLPPDDEDDEEEPTTAVTTSATAVEVSIADEPIVRVQRTSMAEREMIARLEAEGGGSECLSRSTSAVSVCLVKHESTHATVGTQSEALPVNRQVSRDTGIAHDDSIIRVARTTMAERDLLSRLERDAGVTSHMGQPAASIISLASSATTPITIAEEPMTYVPTLNLGATSIPTDDPPPRTVADKPLFHLSTQRRPPPHLHPTSRTSTPVAAALEPVRSGQKFGSFRRDRGGGGKPSETDAGEAPTTPRAMPKRTASASSSFSARAGRKPAPKGDGGRNPPDGEPQAPPPPLSRLKAWEIERELAWDPGLVATLVEALFYHADADVGKLVETVRKNCSLGGTRLPSCRVTTVPRHSAPQAGARHSAFSSPSPRRRAGGKQIGFRCRSHLRGLCER
ncbi:hypothetical protein DIPPA_08244 [Diplonema papillatum]|nr:hypothetical protein DIPPA_08244 [Diplonema papillatum]